MLLPPSIGPDQAIMSDPMLASSRQGASHAAHVPIYLTAGVSSHLAAEVEVAPIGHQR